MEHIASDSQINKNSFNVTVLWLLGFLFLFCNTVGRIGVLFSSKSLAIQFLGMIGGLAFVILLFKPKWIKVFLFCFALTFPFYGSKYFSTNSFLFELYATYFALVLWVKLRRNEEQSVINPTLLKLLFLYGFLSLLSLLLSPVQSIIWKNLLWKSESFWNAVLIATPESAFYSFAKVNQLVLFSILTIAIAWQRKATLLFKALFIGLLGGAVWASIIGIFNHYQFVDLSMLRVESSSQYRLQSVFANSGWFAEFVSITIPFILLGFIRTDLDKLKKIGLFAGLIVCEIAIILTYSRTGWLIYPFVLIVCWFFFYLVSNTASGKFTWNRIAKVVLQVVISVPLTLLVSYFLIFHLFNITEKSSFSESKLEQRVSNLTKPATRMVIWQECLELIKEKPILGMGYESFKYHNATLHKVKSHWDTPHNFFLQVIVSGGVVGLVLWGILIAAALFLLVADLVRNKNYTNMAVILSIVAFHQYGLAQSMQYIPMIWFLVFLNIGYAMTIDDAVLPDWARNGGNILVKCLLGVVMLAGIVYASDFESRSLAKKYNMNVYSLDQEQNNYLGFYPVEQWGVQGKYRWTADGAIIRLPKGNVFELTYVCSAPDSDKKPVIVTVFAGNIEIDTVSFYRPESITRQYYIPEAMLEDTELYFHVSRTWNLKKLGVADDTRNLGVAISGVKVLDTIPDDGVGLYHWEVWQGSALPGESAEEFDYRWTGPEAVVSGKQVNDEKVLFVRAGQPGLPGDPLMVEIWQQEKIVATISLADTDWHRIELAGNVQNNGLLSIRSSRTWNAKSIAVGEDSRNLGVAIAGLKKTM